jgi:hypothetical protein
MQDPDLRDQIGIERSDFNYETFCADTQQRRLCGTVAQAR